MVSGGSDKILKRWDLPLHNMKTNKVTKLTPSHSVRAHEKGNANTNNYNITNDNLMK